MRLDHRILVSCLLLAGISPAFAQQTAAPDPVVVSQQVPLDEIRRYVTVFNAVRAAYVEPVADAQLMQSAIRGLLLELDPHSSYLDAEQAQLFEEQSRGAYEGIGVEVQTLKDKVLRVIAPIDGSPAALAGIQPGDLIIAVEGKPMAAITDPEPLRGPAGSSVTLSVRREGQSKPLEIVVQRQTIRLSSVRSRMLEPGYGYIRISTFQADTATDFAQHARALAAQAESQPLHGLVLDLRSNPGGLLTAAVQVADELLEQGTIVSTRGRLSSSDSQFQATPGQLLENTAVMVLVDAGSASASEVLAAALADNQRAKVIGSRTFGKGSVQSVLPLDNGDSIKLTTARYYTPSGRSIQAVGIAPDIVLKPEGEPIAAGEYREAGLAGHLLGEEELAQVQSGDFLPGDEPVQQALAALKSSVPGTDGE
ncbi:S41 family peptidase [Stenotrophomonas koreensis]|uniref:S41 family peptidase n=1 Tax=Stenotrophomonas koreensis TaxID=266128 RepID=UPI0009FB15A6|nr:S41 family peptidase [Stenotrophomonas koreensis]